MDTLPALGAIPAHLVEDGQLLHGLWQGGLTADALTTLPGAGRERRWMYVAFASHDQSLAVGAAVVDLGGFGTGFAWLAHHGRVIEVDRKLFGRRRVQVGTRPEGRHTGRAGGLHLDLASDGSGDISVRDLDGRPLRVRLTNGAGMIPVVCSTPTPAGGSNVTQKSAGMPIHASVVHGEERLELDGAGWTDWTRGRQDRRTSWRWAAGAGRSADGRAVGLNVSTGMNGQVGEDVLWMDGQPMALKVDRLSPIDPTDPRGSWVVSGPGWSLDFRPIGVRSAKENLLVVRSAYVQPVGRFVGTVPAPGGGVANVDFPGVTEDHEAKW